MDQQNRAANAAAVYEEWIAANPGVDTDNPTPEQETDYMMRLYQSDPTLSGDGWQEAVSAMNKKEIRNLLNSPAYADPEIAERVLFTHREYPYGSVLAVVDEENDKVLGLALSSPVDLRDLGVEKVVYRKDLSWVEEKEFFPDMSSDDLEDISYIPVSEDYIYAWDEGARSMKDVKNHLRDLQPVTAAASSCPAPTQNIPLNLANRQKAIDGAGYGPLNPKRPNESFWKAKADRWSTTIEEAKSSRCGNCAAFIITPSMRECINQGLGDDSDSWDVVQAGELGYCEAFDFKCAAERTCDAWIVGGPVTEEK